MREIELHMRRLFACLCTPLVAPFVRAWQQISMAPRELRIVYLISLFASFGLSGGSSILVSYFSDEFQYTDVEASTLFAFSAVTYVLFGLFIGRVIDRIGIRYSLIVGGILGVAASLCIAIAWTRFMLVLAVLILTPMAMLFTSPVITIAMKRYTYSENSRVAFMFAYIIGNIGAALSYVYVDFVRHRFADGVTFRSYSATAARVIFLTGALATLFGSLFASCGMRDIMVDEKGAVKPFSQNSNATNAEVNQNERIQRSWYRTFCEPNFARFTCLSLAMFPLLKMFTHFDVTFPKAALRQLGDGTLFGTIKAFNPIIITLFQLQFSDFFRNMHIYNVIIIGSTISALSVFIFAATPSYASWITAFVLFTIGEMIFSHRVNELATKFMPKGREGIYSSLIGVYLIVPRFVVDAMSGWLLSSYCPEDGERHCDIMWLLIGLMSCVTPLLLFTFKKYLLKGIEEPSTTIDIELQIEQSKEIAEAAQNTVKKDTSNDND